MVEKRSNLITKYLKFIVDNIDSHLMTQIAPCLTAIVEQSNSSSSEHIAIRQNLIKLFADFIRKLIESEAPKSSDASSANSHNKLIVKISYPKNAEIEIDADTVKAILELLCESGDFEVIFVFL